MQKYGKNEFLVTASKTGPLMTLEYGAMMARWQREIDALGENKFPIAKLFTINSTQTTSGVSMGLCGEKLPTTHQHTFLYHGKYG
jgi:hypothetical protein